MWPAALTRLLRRRINYIILAILCIVYLFGNLLNKNGQINVLHSDDEYTVQRTRPLLWQQQLLPEESNNRTNVPDKRCRNTVQGRELLADERGFVCRREHILPNGCCNVDEPQTSYYDCFNCNTTTHCCGIYEYCVSCCLHPSKQPLLESVLRSNATQKYIYASVEDHFELCLVKCRTNSHSVKYENKYRNSAAKYCYGQTEAHESQRDVAPNMQLK